MKGISVFVFTYLDLYWSIAWTPNSDKQEIFEAIERFGLCRLLNPEERANSRGIPVYVGYSRADALAHAARLVIEGSVDSIKDFTRVDQQVPQEGNTQQPSS